MEEEKTEKRKNMACRSMLRSAILVEPFQLQPVRFNFNPNNNRGSSRYRTVNARPFHRGNGGALRCSHNETPSFQDDQGPPQEAVLKAISGDYLFSAIFNLI